MPMPSSRAAKTHGTLPERSRRARHGNVRHAQVLARTGVREPRGLFLRTSPEHLTAPGAAMRRMAARRARVAPRRPTNGTTSIRNTFLTKCAPRTPPKSAPSGLQEAETGRFWVGWVGCTAARAPSPGQGRDGISRGLAPPLASMPTDRAASSWVGPTTGARRSRAPAVALRRPPGHARAASPSKSVPRAARRRAAHPKVSGLGLLEPAGLGFWGCVWGAFGEKCVPDGCRPVGWAPRAPGQAAPWHDSTWRPLPCTGCQSPPAEARAAAAGGPRRDPLRARAPKRGASELGP